MSFAPSTGSSSVDLGSRENYRKKLKDLIVNNYDYEWDQDDFFTKCCDDVVAAPWNLGKRLEKYHIMEVAWGSRQVVEITVGDILKKVRAHRWQNGLSAQNVARRTKVSEITYRDLAQLFSEVSLIPAFEIRRNCIILCLPPLCCIVLHDRVMIHVNNAIQLDSLLLKLEKLTLAYSKKAEETRAYFLRIYAPDALSPSAYHQKFATRSMLLTEEVIEAVNRDSTITEEENDSNLLPPLFAGYDQGKHEITTGSKLTGASGCELGVGFCQEFNERKEGRQLVSTVDEIISTYQAFPALGTSLQKEANHAHQFNYPSKISKENDLNAHQLTQSQLPQSQLPQSQSQQQPWDSLHRMILSGNIDLIQTIPRFVLFPLEFAFLEILISYAFGEINQEVQVLDSRTNSLLAEARSRVYNYKLIDSLRDLKLLLHDKLESISGIQSAFNTILDTPEDMAMMELTRLFYQSGYYYSDYIPNPQPARRVGGGGGGGASHGHNNHPNCSSCCCCCCSCGGGGGHRGRGDGYGGGGGSRKDELDTNPNLEILLEFFSQEINLISARVKSLLVNLQSAEKHISMIMSYRRNRFAMWDIGCGIAAVGLGIGAVISGTLGMNVPNGQEENNTAFGIYVAVIFLTSLVAFLLAWLVTNKTYI